MNAKTAANSSGALHQSLATGLMMVADADDLARQAREAAANAGLSQFDGTNLVQLSIERAKAILDLARSLSQTGDEEELYQAIASFWLQLRFEWQRHNDVMGYGDVNGIHSPVLAAEGCVGSYLLDRLERLLLPEHIDGLSDYSLDMLSALANDRHALIKRPAGGTLAARLLLIADAEDLTRQARAAAAAAGISQQDSATLVLVALDRTKAIQDLAQALSEADDEPDLYRAIASFWLQLRCEWQRHNDVMSYGDVIGIPAPLLGAEGWVGSYLLERFETLLLPKHVELLSHYSFEMLDDIANDQSARLKCTPTGSLASRLLALANADDLELTVQEAATAVGLSTLDGERLVALSIERTTGIRELAQAVGQSGDEEDLYRTIASFWMQLRFEWQRNNDVMSYGEVIDLPCPAIGAEAWLGSHLLDRLETLLLPAHLEALSHYAFELLGSLAGNRATVLNSSTSGT
jgi:hypothetical protein